MSLLRNLDILEVGAGGGYNATATSAFGLRSMTLIDGSRAGFALLTQRAEEGAFNVKKLRILHEDFTEYAVDNVFDVCICEGTIPGQGNPKAFLKKLSTNVRRGGFLIITCTTPSSILSEIFRRTLYSVIVSTCGSRATQICRSLFAQHLKSLSVRTRSVEDWIQDSIVHPWEHGKYVFSVSEAIAHLGANFEFVHAIPSLTSELGWYKQYSGARERNRTVSTIWEESDNTLLDRRVVAASNVTAEYRRSCRNLLSLHDEIRDVYSDKKIIEFCAEAKKFSRLLGPEFAVTKRAISEFDALVKSILLKGTIPVSQGFGRWWGRAQIYVSFRRVA